MSAFSKNHPIILFIDRNGFNLFQDVQQNILRFNFTSDIVRDLDVVNEGQFANFIASFIQVNKVIPSSLALILSDSVIYSKDFSLSETQEKIQNFLENIPFEEVLAKAIKTDQQLRAVAVNRNLVMTIADAFIKEGSVLEMVIPSFVYGPAANFASGLTQDNLRIVLGNSEITRTGNLLMDQQRVVFPQNFEAEEKRAFARREKESPNFKQYALIGIFIVLLVILLIVYLKSGTSASGTVGIGSLPEKTSTSIATPTFSQVETAAAPLDVNGMAINIIRGMEQGDVAGNLSNELTQKGFENTMNESSNTSAEKSSIMFSQNIPTGVRNNVVTIVKKILPDLSVLENKNSDSQITILIGKLQDY